MNRFRALAASLLVLLLACSDVPTSPRPGAPHGPARDRGHGFGSGNVVPTDTAASTMAADLTSTPTAPEGSPQERGGLGYGSGN
jgi:hypothetical protein